MAQLHQLQKQERNLQDMLDKGLGCRACVEKSLERVRRQIATLNKLIKNNRPSME